MADDQPMILPKGIVVNAPHIEESIQERASQPVQPEEIERMWKVYTTTSRRLIDPTAERLENYWWRIWGSQRRELNAVVVAQLFANISHGPTFLGKPLPGPANRDEGGSQRLNTARHGMGGSSTVAVVPQGASRPSTTQSASASKAPAASPLPPILKKSRAPPPRGPRPSVGFASPEHSGDDEPAPISPNVNVVVEPPSPDIQIPKADKKANRKGQGFVASSGSRKARPQIVRRKSSHSSTETLKSAQPQTTAASSSSDTSGASHTPSHLKRKGKVVAISKFQENFSPSPGKGSQKTSKSSRSAEGKRPSQSRGTETEEPSILGPDPAMIALRAIGNHKTSSSGDPGPSTLRNVQNSETGSSEEDIAVKEELEVQRTLLAQFEGQNRASESREHPGQASVAESCKESDAKEDAKEDAEYHERTSRIGLDTAKNRKLGESTTTPANTLGLKSSASTRKTLAAAVGQLELGGDEGPSTPTISTRLEKGKGKEIESRTKIDDMFAKRPIPPLATPTLSSKPTTMTRSKSTLSFLLEKDKERNIKLNSNGGIKNDDEADK